MEPQIKTHHHHILPYRVVFLIWGFLLLFTLITVWIAHLDLGKINFVVAFFIASVKATLVGLFFMNLKYDRKENAVIFATSFLFLAIFITLTVTDVFFRGDVYVKGPLVAAVQAKAKFQKPWIVTPTLINHGKELFAAQCVACHGPAGKGDGPAAAALNPHPRNFTSDQGWKNGRKPSQVFKTLKEGISGSAMASFATLPSEDRWALAHYVLSLGPTPSADNAVDLAKVGIGTTKGAEPTEAPSIPIDLAIDRLVQEAKGK